MQFKNNLIDTDDICNKIKEIVREEIRQSEKRVKWWLVDEVTNQIAASTKLIFNDELGKFLKSNIKEIFHNVSYIRDKDVSLQLESDTVDANNGRSDVGEFKTTMLPILTDEEFSHFNEKLESSHFEKRFNLYLRTIHDSDCQATVRKILGLVIGEKVACCIT